MSTVQCPCGLTQEELDAHGWVNNQTGLCTAIFKLNGVVKTGCGELYANHPSAPQGLGLSQPFILQDGARYVLKEPPASKFQHVNFILLYYAFCFY